MNCARRTAGAQRPAPSTGSLRKPDPRSGRSRARLSRFLPAFALLLAALSPFAGAPAEAQSRNVNAPSAADTVWSAVLQVRELIGGTQYGCDHNYPAGTNSEDRKRCSELLTDDDFTFGGESYTVTAIGLTAGSQLNFQTNPDLPPHLYVSTRLLIGNDYQSFEWPGPWNGVTVSGFDNLGQIPVAVVRRPGPRIRGVNAEEGALEVLWDALPTVQATYTVAGNTVPLTLSPSYYADYTSSTTVDDDAADSLGGDPAIGWVRGTSDLVDGETRATITGLTNGRKYRVRIRGTYANGLRGGKVYTAFSHAAGTPGPPPVIRLVPDPDLLTGLAFSDGTNDLPLQPNVANGIGLGHPGLYAVHVAESVKSVNVTPTWTNMDVIGVTVDTFDANRPGTGIVAQVGWGLNASGTAKPVPLTDGTTLIEVDTSGVAGRYNIYVYQRGDWEAANARLRALAVRGR